MNTKIQYIEKECNNSILHKTIIENDISYTKNNNGIFVNLSKLSKENIDLLYINLKNNCYKDIDSQRNNLIREYKRSLNINNLDNNKVYKKFENLSKKDLQIIKYSKKI